MTTQTIGNVLAGGAEQGTEVVSNPSPEQQQVLTSGWQDYFNQPDVKAGILQFGLNMLTPMSAGQSGLGHIAQSIGAGAEASGRVQQNQKTEEQEQRKVEADNAAQGLAARRVAAQEQNAQASGTRAAAALFKAKKGPTGNQSLAVEKQKIIQKILNGETLSKEEEEAKKLLFSSKKESKDDKIFNVLKKLSDRKDALQKQKGKK